VGGSGGVTFADHFGGRAAGYRAHRPDYPPALFAFLAGVVPRRAAAWDCGTGSGQAALGLAAHFARVVATDASAAQLAEAVPHARIEYRVAPAEASGLAPASVDLATVAQALHWFDLDAFYAEVRRVVAPEGALAVWSYGAATLDAPAADAVLQRFGTETMAAYWPAARRMVDDGYRSLAFPFRERPTPAFELERRWTLGELTGYLRTWSATARYLAAHGRDPVDDVERELAPVWGAPATRHLVRWPVSLRVGYVAAQADDRGE
jgi:SAM-dependent methyltransferase